MKNWEQELKEVKREVQAASNEEIKITTRLEEAKERKAKAIKKLKDRGIDPKDLNNTIAEKEKQLEELIDSIRECLPGEDDESDED